MQAKKYFCLPGDMQAISFVIIPTGWKLLVLSMYESTIVSLPFCLNEFNEHEYNPKMKFFLNSVRL